MYCELAAVFVPSEYRVKQATQRWEFEQAYALRREVFCVEQQVFVDDDRDEIDAHARLLVAVACVGGVLDQVVGTVRIHEAQPGVWWGSRLAVHRAFRRHAGLGTTLIRLAVGTAHAQGCTTFLAHVQQQNAELFKRLHWSWLANEMLCGRPHCLMSAEVGWYAPCHDPAWGLAVHDGKPADRALTPRPRLVEAGDGDGDRAGVVSEVDKTPRMQEIIKPGVVDNNAGVLA